jgi:hypothetical protein
MNAQRNSSIFHWRQRSNFNAEELKAGRITPFNGRKHQRDFQRACFQALQEFRQARPKLAGQDPQMFKALVKVIEDLREATFDLNNKSAVSAPAALEAAVRAIIDSKPIKVDIAADSSIYERSQFLIGERNKSGPLLSIYDAEIGSGGHNSPYSRAVNAFNIEATKERDTDVKQLGRLLDDMHFAAVEMFLDKFAADLPDEVDEVAVAKANAKAAREQMENRQAA